MKGREYQRRKRDGEGKRDKYKGKYKSLHTPNSDFSRKIRNEWQEGDTFRKAVEKKNGHYDGGKETSTDWRKGKEKERKQDEEKKGRKQGLEI